MPLKLGFILTRSPYEGDALSIILKAAFQALEKGDATSLFLLGDSIWLARKKASQKDKADSEVENFLRLGGRVVASGEHLQASGISIDEILPGVEVASDTYDRLVDLVMENWDKVVIV